jgi:hypothetical protein
MFFFTLRACLYQFFFCVLILPIFCFSLKCKVLYRASVCLCFVILLYLCKSKKITDISRVLVLHLMNCKPSYQSKKKCSYENQLSLSVSSVCSSFHFSLMISMLSSIKRETRKRRSCHAASTASSLS